jgi:hypothetical protein
MNCAWFPTVILVHLYHRKVGTNWQFNQHGPVCVYMFKYPERSNQTSLVLITERLSLTPSLKRIAFWKTLHIIHVTHDKTCQRMSPNWRVIHYITLPTWHLQMVHRCYVILSQMLLKLYNNYQLIWYTLFFCAKMVNKWNRGKDKYYLLKQQV